MEEHAEVEQKMAEEKTKAVDEETMGRKETNEEDEDRHPQNEDEDTRECQIVHQATSDEDAATWKGGTWSSREVGQVT